MQAGTAAPAFRRLFLVAFADGEGLAERPDYDGKHRRADNKIANVGNDKIQHNNKMSFSSSNIANISTISNIPIMNHLFIYSTFGINSLSNSTHISERFLQADYCRKI
jgi:hypothetical protein